VCIEAYRPRPIRAKRQGAPKRNLHEWEVDFRPQKGCQVVWIN